MRHRAALIAAGSIAIVVVAAAVAAGASLGILDAADSRPVGQLSAAVPATSSSATTAIVDSGTGVAPATQTYIIKKAGTVSVVASEGRLRLDDVNAKAGWRWSLAQASDKRLRVTFRSGTQTYTFVAALGRGDQIVARVDRPVARNVTSSSPATVVASTASPAATTPSYDGEGDDVEGGDADD